MRKRARPWNAIKGPRLGPFNETLIAKGQPCRLSSDFDHAPNVHHVTVGHS